MMARRTLIVAVLALGGLGAFAGPAQATFHLMKVSEVMPGTAVNPNAEYVELQMYAPLQNFVGGHKVTFYGPTSTPTGTCTFASDVANGQNQNTLLIANPAAQAAFSVGSDCAIADANRLDPRPAPPAGTCSTASPGAPSRTPRRCRLRSGPRRRRSPTRCR